MGALGLLVLLAVVIVVPLLILKVVVHLVVGLVLLPFKIVGGILKLVFGGAIALCALLVGVTAFILLPLLPFLVLGALFWLAVRAGRPVPRPPTASLPS